MTLRFTQSDDRGFASKGFCVKTLSACMFLVSVTFSSSSIAAPVRLKEIANVKGVRENALIGYGLVVGLGGTGDSSQVFFTNQSISGMLGRLGVRIDPRDVRVRNVAAVMVTANLPTFARPGGRLDVHVSSIGNARSLTGGTLLLTPLQGPDRQVYVVAQGNVQVGGYVASSKGTSVRKNQTTSGRIPRGGHIERAVKVDLSKGPLELSLKTADFTTATRVAIAVNQYYDANGYFPVPVIDEPSVEEGADKTVAPLAADASDAEKAAAAQAKADADKAAADKAAADKADPKEAKEPEPQVRAQALDPVAISVPVPEKFPGGAVAFMSAIEALIVDADQKARIVISERTGTIVAGAGVFIRPVVVAHGALKVRIDSKSEVSQPNGFSVGGNATSVPVSNSDVKASESKAKVQVLKATTSIEELAAALELLGASPRDLITILQAMKAAGALDADLEVM